ncbi:MAG: guanylate kinase/L-type calcium channel region [Deferribacteraceae bacterium]|jgi:ribose 1,5-bisphosphokinase|nr:guanylate kinase/L-type calcium channel region [Deferribacteraceae bacterium]
MKKIILIVGPSGSGKDSLIKYVSDKIDINVVKRYITRKPDNNEFNYFVDMHGFEVLTRSGFFVSTWEAYGNFYGIPIHFLKNGKNIISVSRTAIQDFEKRFNDVITVLVTADKETVLKRLNLRKREDQNQIEQRLMRHTINYQAKNTVVFKNEDSFDVAKEKFLKLIEGL